MIGTNSAVEALETGGADEEYPSGNGPSEGITDVLEESWRDLVSSKFDGRASKVAHLDKRCPITGHQCSFRETGAYVHSVSGNTMHVKWSIIRCWKVPARLEMMGRWWREALWIVHHGFVHTQASTEICQVDLQRKRKVGRVEERKRGRRGCNSGQVRER